MASLCYLCWPRFGSGLPAAIAIALRIANLVPARLRPIITGMCSKRAVTIVNGVVHDAQIRDFV